MTSSTEIDHSDHPPAIVSSESVDRHVRGDPYSSETSEELLNKPTTVPKPNKNENHEQARGDPYYSDTLEWLQELRENLVDDRVPEHRDSHTSCSDEVSLEPTRSVDLGKHSVYTHFPKDRNCEICQRTKITRAPVQKMYWQSRASCKNFGDLIADHKVLSDNCESRNNHRCAVVVQDLGTQWIQSYRAKQKLHRKTREACKSSWNPRGNQISFTLTIPWNSEKLVKISPGIIARLHHTDPKQMGLLKEQCTE